MQKLRQFVVDGDMRPLFYHSFDESRSLLCSLACCCSLPAVKKSKLNQIVNVCSEVAVAMLNSVAKTTEVRLVRTLTQDINEDTSLPDPRKFLPSDGSGLQWSNFRSLNPRQDCTLTRMHT